MQDVVETPSRTGHRPPGQSSATLNRLCSQTPSLFQIVLAFISAVLLIVSFPNFYLWWLAWLALVPLLWAVADRPQTWPAFLLGWLFGSVFFFGSCHWLTYSIINFGGFSPWLAYPMLVPGALVLGMFPGMFTALLARAIRKRGAIALLLAPFLWPPLEWARLELTGQLWNAIGYSQAFQPSLIQGSRWTGVYGVGFLLITVNAAAAFAIRQRTVSATLISTACVLSTGLILWFSNLTQIQVEPFANTGGAATVIAVQPNVPMTLIKPVDEIRQLNTRHFEMSEAAFRNLPDDAKPSLLIWPESPMNFTYGTDSIFRERLAELAKKYSASILLNSQEVAPNDGIYNSAVLINEEGRLVAQYDKIRLLPFGEYVPLPSWLPGAGLIRGIVGDFTPGTNYRLMPVGSARAGVFICIESAYPSIAREFTREGADVLINISNDGYLGPTAVMHQHLANAVFRAVENNRPLLRVTNTGITAFITPRGEVRDATQPFQQEVRTWTIPNGTRPTSFYANYGDVFVLVCALLSVVIFIFSFKKRSSAKIRGLEAQ